MKTRILSICLALSLTLAALPQSVMAYTVSQGVTVGLESVCKNVQTATIGGTELRVGTNEAVDGSVDFEENTVLTSSNGFSVGIAGSNYVAIDEDGMSYREARELAQELQDEGKTAYAAYVSEDGWTVFTTSSVSGYDTKQVSGFKGVTVKGDTTVIVSQSENLVFMGTEEDDTFTINAKPYRGVLSFAVNNGTMTAVNTIALEEYLNGVVAAEMPKSYDAEALKAQTVAARTYAMTKLGAHTDRGYQLCDTVACQVYGGYSWETPQTASAIAATEGEIICYDGKPIEAVFSASTGGYTENSENVWSNVVPYLRAVPELGEYGENDWSLSVTCAEMTALAQLKGDNLGSVTDIVITKLSTGGRVQEMQIVGTNGTKTLTGESIRTYFSSAMCGSLPGKMFTINGRGGEIGVYSGEYKPAETTTQSAPIETKTNSLIAAAANGGIVAITEGSLADLNGKSLQVEADAETMEALSTPSVDHSDYEIYNVSISTVQNNKFVFNGIGKGHGVGLSQKGAQAMAEMGYTYDQILKYYYTDVTLEGGK